MHPLDILFWSCLMMGGAYTMLTLLMGGFSHAAGHISHVAGHVGHIGHAGHGGHIGQAGHADAGHVGHGHGHADAGHASHTSHGDHTESARHLDIHVDGHEGFNLFAYLNPMSVAGFLLGFGGMGVASRILGAQPFAATLYGLAGGGGLWLAANLVISRIFAAAGGTSHNRREELVGVRAQVTAPIAGSRPGMVAYTVSGSRQSLRAITEDEEPIPTGAMVRIRRIDNHTAHVIRIDS